MHPIIASMFEVPAFAGDDHSHWFFLFRARLAELRGEDAIAFRRAARDADTRPSPFNACVFDWAVSDPTAHSYEIEWRLNVMLRGLGARYMERAFAWLALSPAEQLAAVEATVAALEPRADLRWLGELRPVGFWLADRTFGPGWKIDAWVGPMPAAPKLPYHWVWAGQAQEVARYLVWAQTWVPGFTCPEVEPLLALEDRLQLTNATRLLQSAWERHEAALGFDVLSHDLFSSAPPLPVNPVAQSHPYCDR